MTPPRTVEDIATEAPTTPVTDVRVFWEQLDVSVLGHEAQRSLRLTAAARMVRLAEREPAPSSYELAREFALLALLLPDGARVPFVNHIATYCDPDDESGTKWLAFRKQLHTQVIKASGLVQTLAALFEDFTMRRPLPLTPSTADPAPAKEPPDELALRDHRP